MYSNICITLYSVGFLFFVFFSGQPTKLRDVYMAVPSHVEFMTIGHVKCSTPQCH